MYQYLNRYYITVTVLRKTQFKSHNIQFLISCQTFFFFKVLFSSRICRRPRRTKSKRKLEVLHNSIIAFVDSINTDQNPNKTSVQRRQNIKYWIIRKGFQQKNGGFVFTTRWTFHRKLFGVQRQKLSLKLIRKIVW